MDRPLILLTNDDGVRSPGLLAAAEALHGLGELVIVAPQAQQTGMGRSMPSSASGVLVAEPIRVNGSQVNAYALAGSPAQTVQYSLADLFERRPDLVVSGINYGENLGSCVTSSGTVGAALEASTWGVPGLAVSMETAKAAHNDPGYSVAVDWTAAIHFTRLFARAMLSANGSLPSDVDLLKVDIPASASPLTPWRMTRQSRQSYYQAKSSGRRDLSQPGQLDYGITIDHATLEPDSDIYAFVIDRVVTVTPLSIDLTSRVDMARLQAQLR